MSLFELSGIAFAFAPDRQVLRDASFRLETGERVALCGANGAGKTTLFHLMVGLLKPSSGTVRAFGAERRSEKDFVEVRTRAGLLFQDSDDQLFCPTVAEDVAFGPLNLGKSRTEARQVVAATLARLGIEALADRVTCKLSGGEKRLVALATILAMDPDVLLLDEPTTALDRQAQDRLTDILLSLPQTMVVISHDPVFLDRIATRRVVLEDGTLRS
jgi:cobalt/nickel transport system ATP-binding protein